MVILLEISQFLFDGLDLTLQLHLRQLGVIDDFAQVGKVLLHMLTHKQLSFHSVN